MGNWTRRTFLRTSMGTGLALSMGQATGFSLSRVNAAEVGDSDRPNVLLIMTDTQRLDDMGAYGNPIIRTPHLDSLARGGAKFTHCHTQYPACMPARATVFTGRYPMAHGVWSNGVPLPETETTLAGIFAVAGYRTGGAGKFHFLPHWPYRKSNLPTMETHPQPFYGFQEYHLGEDGRSGEHHLWIKKHHPEHTGKPDDKIPLELHNSTWTARHTIDFITRMVGEKKRFFAFCSFVDPHQGYNPPPPYGTMYDPEDMPDPIRRDDELEHSRFRSTAQSRNMMSYTQRLKESRAKHYGEMTLIDDCVGRVLETLDTLGVRRNTLIVFVSDHGDMLGDHWLWWKGPYHYASCTNVPLFFNWPGRIPAGRTIDGLVQQTDILPTLCELVGLDVPLGVQGKSLAGAVLGRTSQTPYDYVYVESVSTGAYSPDWQGPSGVRRPADNRQTIDTFTIRNNQWRFTIFSGTDDGELYDLEKDPDEFENRFHDPAYAETRNELMAILLHRLGQTRDPLPGRTRPY